MDIIAACKIRDISKVIDPTVLAFAPLLKRAKKSILEVPKKTFQYGQTERHQLDVYYPLTSITTETPVLVYVYGGGFNTGEKVISPKSFGLVYTNVAAFFARRGYVVVIPDYRLTPDTQYPGSAEDVRDAVRWVLENPSSLSPTDVLPDIEHLAMLGHSAGAAHIATMLFDPAVIAQDDPLRGRISAALLESPPFDLSEMTLGWDSGPTHAQYWRSLELAKEHDPLHLYRRLSPVAVEKLPPLLMIEAEFEPEWLIRAGDAFQDEVAEKTGKRLTRLIARGHNHISLNWALSTGEGEEWAEDVVAWLESNRS
ncbi:hypothetical protein D9619_008658 [Psilocybe cf. subviscida]|uniref:BD-FAE-like domain-containing protein n=1 Tax=Psilocybe cf. subviscida TaxID=2480587 RepID=A0A8H5B9V0_9AGAR|nr:hypothetical protein D9619_008658 [Psilocybe cf. subviscida]